MYTHAGVSLSLLAPSLSPYLKEQGILTVLLQHIHLIHSMWVVVAVLRVLGKVLSLRMERERDSSNGQS